MSKKSLPINKEVLWTQIICIIAARIRRLTILGVTHTEASYGVIYHSVSNQLMVSFDPDLLNSGQFG